MRDDAQVEHDRSGEYVGRYITYPGNTIVADGKSIIIRGQRGKSSARLMVFSGGKQVRVVEDDVARTTFSNRGEEYAYANYLPRASVTVNAVNPRFLSILVPFKDIKDLPEIAVDFDTRADIYEVTLKFETHSDTLLFNQTDPLLKRIVPGAG